MKLDGMKFSSPKEKALYIKFFIDSRKEAEKNANICSCYACGSHNLIRSHSMPRFMLKQIAGNNKLYTLGKIIKTSFNSEKALKHAGTFRMLCNSCDTKLFNTYENLQNYDINLSIELFSQINKKTLLKYIYKRKIEIEHYKIMLSMINRIPNYHEQLIKYKTFMDTMDFATKDLSNYEKDFINSDSNDYELIFYEKLDYITPIGIQEFIPLVADLRGNIINETSSKDATIQTMNICVFPLKSETIVILFTNKISNNYKNFINDFKQLTHSDKLALINFIIFLYCEDFFISKEKNIESLITKNLEDIGSTIGGTYRNENEATNLHDLSKRHQIANFLAKENSIKI